MSDDTPATDVPPAPNPFAPRYREPWVNPAKRTAAVLIGAATGVILLALGFLLGLGLAGGGHRHHPGMGPGRYDRGYGYRYEGRFGPHGPMDGPMDRRMDRDWAWRHYRSGPGSTYRSPASPSAPPSSSHS